MIASAETTVSQQFISQILGGRFTEPCQFESLILVFFASRITIPEYLPQAPPSPPSSTAHLLQVFLGASAEPHNYTLKTSSLFIRTSSISSTWNWLELLLSYSCLFLPSSYHGQKEDQYEKKYIAHLLFAFTVGYRCPQNVVPWGCSSVGRVLN